MIPKQVTDEWKRQEASLTDEQKFVAKALADNQPTFVSPACLLDWLCDNAFENLLVKRLMEVSAPREYQDDPRLDDPKYRVWQELFLADLFESCRYRVHGPIPPTPPCDDIIREA